ncbi:MAG: hypothetical protein H6703_00375 [Myxococcales bacterium]|nr:hypothetical protein [Myxococcales bacterium]
MRRPWLALLLASLPASARADDLVVRLDPAIAARCPPPAEITARWRLATSPPLDGRAAQLTITLDGDTLRGRLALSLPGQRAERRIDAERDGCDPLVDALITAGVLLGLPVPLPGARVEAPPRRRWPPSAAAPAKPPSVKPATPPPAPPPSAAARA